MFGQKRHINFSHALEELRPGATWSMRQKNDADEFDWSTWEMDWEDSNELPIPTEDELQAAMEVLRENEPMRVLREVRDTFLQESDWVVARAFETGEPVPTEWAEYRQFLRDITDGSYTPTFDDEGFMYVDDIQAKKPK